MDDAREDNPELDGTDAAHPAWWRGHNHGVVALCQHINAILDGKAVVSGVSNEPWESTRRRIAALVAQQPISAETVRRVRNAEDSVDLEIARGRHIVADKDYWEAIAQRANQEAK